jgi:hypothetical protein
MKRLVLVALAAGVAYVVVTHFRNRGKDRDASSNGSLGEGARRAVDDATDRIGV